MNALLKHYAIAVTHPYVSAFEHLEMLMVRDKLADQELFLSDQEKAFLANADKHLMQNATAFHVGLARITSLEEERNTRHLSPERWWWYLDVLSALPVGTDTSPARLPA